VREQGVVQFADVQPGATPTMVVPVIAPRTYQVRVDMAGCSRASCACRLQVYR
jgi:hypothetical protein